MITEYIDCVEFKRLIEDKKLKPATLKYYLRQKGIVFTASNIEQFAEQVYTIFLGASEISEIRDMINNDTNYEKSLVMKLALKNGVEENIIDVLLDELNNQKSIRTTDYFIEKPIRTKEGVQVQFSYSRKLPGRNKLLETEKRCLKLNIRKISEQEVIVDIRQQSSIDSKNALGFIKRIAKGEDIIQVKHIDLELLSSKNKVEFFDRVAAYVFQFWRLKTITGITVKQGLNDDDEDEDVLLEEGDDSSTLSGISQAVLNGSGLRSNEFVQESLDKGFYISAMRYRYENKNSTTEFAIVLSFKKQNLRVDIDKTYFEDEGKICAQPLLKTEQNDIIIAFQDISYQIFDDLIAEQRNG